MMVEASCHEVNIETIENITDIFKYQTVLAQTIRASVTQQRIKKSLTFQHNYDSAHKYMLTKKLQYFEIAQSEPRPKSYQKPVD